MIWYKSLTKGERKKKKNKSKVREDFENQIFFLKYSSQVLREELMAVQKNTALSIYLDLLFLWETTGELSIDLIREICHAWEVSPIESKSQSQAG